MAEVPPGNFTSSIRALVTDNLGRIRSARWVVAWNYGSSHANAGLRNLFAFDRLPCTCTSALVAASLHCMYRGLELPRRHVVHS